MKQYEPTVDEQKIHARFVLEGTMHEWAPIDKARYLKYLNNRAGLPFGTIGLLRTESKTGQVKEIPYATRQTTVELGRLHNISCAQQKEVITTERVIYTYRATDNDTGRFMDAVGACALIGGKYPMSPEQQSNKVMHAETKAKRRATLEVCGLAFLDDSEVTDMQDVVTTRLAVSEEGAQGVVSEVATTEPPKLAIVPTPTADAAPPTVSSAGAAPAAPEVPVPNASESVSAVATAVSPPGVQIATAPTPAAPASVIQRLPIADPKAAPASYLKRYEASNALFVGEPTAIVADKAHVDMIKFYAMDAQSGCGWDGATMSKWLFDTFGVRASNMQQTLNLDVFRKIMKGIDQALTNAGR